MARQAVFALIALTLCFAFDSTWCDQVCYPRRNTLGNVIGSLCYTEHPPFDDLPLPQNIDIITPSFHVVLLNSSTGQVVSVKLPIADAGLAIDPSTTPGLGTDKNPMKDVTIIVHGWTGNWQNTAQWRDPIVQNLLRIRPKMQIIFVEWTLGAALHFGLHPYAQPAANTRAIGDKLADFFLQSPSLMSQTGGFNLSRVHCIGFSLGAHVCAFASKRMWNEQRMRWGRITALDPALIYFDKDDSLARLSQEDADFVDVIHTSRMGLDRYVGHVDFYPNPPAKHQPGCSSWLARHRRGILSNFFDTVESFAIEFVSCSHQRAAHLFAESILTPCLRFCPCPSLADWEAGRCNRNCDRNETATLGYWATLGNDGSGSRQRGLFFGETTANRPFCKSN